MQPQSGSLDPAELLARQMSRLSSAITDSPWAPYELVEPVLPGPSIGDTGSINGQLTSIGRVYGDWVDEISPHASVVTTSAPTWTCTPSCWRRRAAGSSAPTSSSPGSIDSIDPASSTLMAPG